MRALIPIAAWVVACSFATDPAQPARARSTPVRKAPSKPTAGATTEPPAPKEPAPLLPPQAAGEKQVLFTSDQDPAQLRFSLVDGAVLVVERRQEGHRLMSLNKSDGRQRVLLQGTVVDSFACDGQHVYFTGDGKLQRVALAGGQPSTLAPLQGQVLLDDAHVYVRDDGIFRRVPKDGGDTKRVAHARRKAGFRTAAVVNGTIFSVASGYRNLPALKPKIAWVESAPARGGQFKRLRGFFEPGPLLLKRGDSLYFTGSFKKEKDDFNYGVFKMWSKTPTKLKFVADFPMSVFTVDDQFVYAAIHRGEERGFFRFPLGDGKPELMFEDAVGATYIDVDDTHLYWVARNKLLRAHK